MVSSELYSKFSVVRSIATRFQENGSLFPLKHIKNYWEGRSSFEYLRRGSIHLNLRFRPFSLSATGNCQVEQGFEEVTDKVGMAHYTKKYTSTSRFNSREVSPEVEDSDPRKREKSISTGDVFTLKEENLDLFRKLSKGDAKMFETLRDLQAKLDILSANFNIEIRMNEAKWCELYENYCNGRVEKHVSYLLKVAFKRRNRQEKADRKLVNALQTEVEHEEEEPDEDYWPNKVFWNSMFGKFGQKQIKQYQLNKSFAAVLYSPRIFLDCSYEKYMSTCELKSLARQMAFLMNSNLASQDPFHITACNFDENGELAKVLELYSKDALSISNPVEFTRKSYLDFYDREQLVYLSPHASSELKCYNPKKYYIIGAYVDKRNSKPLSAAKAKQYGIEAARLPVEKIISWGLGKKNLAINHVLDIMLTLKNENDWKKVAVHIPSRFDRTKRDPEKVKARSDQVFLKKLIRSCFTVDLYNGNENIKN